MSLATLTACIDEPDVSDPETEAAPSIKPGQCICPQVIDPVCGVNGVTYQSDCYASCAGVPVAFHAECDGPRTDAQLEVIDPNQCGLRTGISAAPSEDGHRYAARLDTGVTPFAIESIRYSLIDPPGIPGCSSTPRHRVEIYVENDHFPDATPTVLFSTEVQLDPPDPGVPNRFHTIELPQPLIADRSRSIYVSIEMINNPAAGRICVLTCIPSFETPANASFWSNAAAPPYPWADMLDFGLEDLPIIRVEGQRIHNDGPASPI